MIIACWRKFLLLHDAVGNVSMRRRCAGRRSAGDVDRCRLFRIAAHDCRGHSKEKDGHADDRTNDSCDSFHNAVSLPRWDSGAA